MTSLVYSLHSLQGIKIMMVSVLVSVCVVGVGRKK